MASGDTSSTTSTVLSEQENELAQLIRVRNRLAQSSDASLAKILSGLLPRLLIRLERTYEYQSQQDEEELQAKIRANLLGILAHALERIRGIDVSLAWLPSILPSLQSENKVVRTWTLSFLQATMARCKREEAPVEALLQAVDACHERVSKEQSMTESSRIEWCTTSWLLLDAVAIVSGLTPMMDWDLDCYNEDGRLGVYEPPKEALETPPLVSSEAIHTVTQDGVGVWNLVLDVLLFWPAPQRARNVVPGGVSVEGRGRMTFRLKELSWNDMTQGYLQHLKVACFNFCVSQENASIFQGTKRDLMLAVLLANGNSRVGRLATDYLNVHFAQTDSDKGCPLGMACSLLMLVLGDATSAPIADQYPKHKSLWIGYLGTLPTESDLQRPPLAPTLSARAIEFISSHLFLTSLQSDQVREAVRFYVDLAVTVQRSHAQDGLWAIRLIHGLYKQLDSSDLTDDFRKQCLTCAQDTLATLPEPATQAREAIQQERQEGMPPIPVWRRTEEELLIKHRRSLRRKRLRYDDAMKARENAYELISDLGSATNINGNQDEVSFDLAIVLFKCAVLEETMMKPHVAEALKKLLAPYKSILADRNRSSCHQAALLIPSLVDAACCEHQLVRIASAQWTVELLVLVDPPAAYCLACFLGNDADFRVSRMVKPVVENSKLRETSHSHVTNHTMYEFLDLSTDRDLDTLTMELNVRIASIARDLCIPSSAASILLLSFAGSPKAAVDACNNDREGVLERYGVKARCETDERPPVASSEADDETFVCGICYDDEITATDSYAMFCGHRFCQPCWQSFLENKLEEGSTSILNATCPDHDCAERVTGVEVNDVVPRLVPKWKESLLRQFVEQESHYRFCPGPDCDVVVVAIGDTVPVDCQRCETSFCFGCGESPHIPAQCEDFDKWKRIFGSSEFWVAKHAKPCPGCGTRIEKNGGCNHIKCKCGMDFCWLCLGQLDTHLMAHTCNRYDPAEHAQDDDEKLKLFFTERFQAHEEAEIFAKRRAEGVDNRMQNLLDKFWLLTEDDAQELVQAEETLVECRRFLKHSYVAAYGMKDNEASREIFETHQGALELLTETLSGLTEMNLDSVYVDRGTYGFRLHLRAISFYTSIVSKYMERIANLDT